MCQQVEMKSAAEVGTLPCFLPSLGRIINAVVVRASVGR